MIAAGDHFRGFGMNWNNGSPQSLPSTSFWQRRLLSASSSFVQYVFSPSVAHFFTKSLPHLGQRRIPFGPWM